MDTAQVYGLSEAIIGRYLKENKDESWRIVTKISCRASSVAETLHVSEMNLGQAPSAVLAHNIRDYSDKKFTKALHELKETTSVRKVGVSVYNDDEINAALSIITPDVIQLPLNILDTRLFRSGTISRLKDMGVELHIRSVFLQGLFFLSEQMVYARFPQCKSVLEKLRSLAALEGLTLAELSLIWVNSISDVDKIIIGVVTTDQLEAHFETLKASLPDTLINNALSIEYDDETVLNPSLWPKTS